MNKTFFSFAITLLLKDRASHIFSGAIFVFIVFILTSILFISSSIKNDLQHTLSTQPQILIENQKAGFHTSITEETLDELLQITGISEITPRVEGYYYFVQNESYLHIIGDANHDEDSITIGNGVKNIFDKFYYKNSFNFFHDGEKYTLKIKDTFSNNTNIISNNLIIANTEVAKSILGLEEEEYTALFIHVPNDSEIDYIASQIKGMYPHMKVTTKEQLNANIEHLFYYKGGIFMIFYVVALISFFILLYKQVSSISSKIKKEIAILRSLGYSIKNIITLKIIQNSIVSLSSYIFGVLLAYIYVFMLHAPLLKNIFLGSSINNNITFTPIINFDILVILFLFTVIPFLASIVIPSWKVAISDMSEAMK
jgi:ABC-type lipoprotein release transport system permease subunit